MIAPIRPPQEASWRRKRAFTQARRAVAAALLGEPVAAPSPPLISRWKSWLIATWLVGVLGAYLVTLFWSR
jgi:hypothetical protein